MKPLVCNGRSGRLRRKVGTILLGVILAGCSAEKKPDEAAPGGEIVIRGSNTIGEELAPQLIAEYKKEHPAAVFDTEFKGTTYGVGALMVGRCNLAAASRPLSANELHLAGQRGIEFNDHVIGEYSVAVVVNAASPVADLTSAQVRDIFTGAVQNWKDVGGPDAPIHLYIRDPISGTYLGFQELAMDKKPYGDNMTALTNYTRIVQAVAQDANGIGYASLDLTTKGGVKAVSVGGVAPNTASVNQGRYPYARVLRFYTGRADEPPAALEFVKFVQSPRGQQILRDLGYVPHP